MMAMAVHILCYNFWRLQFFDFNIACLQDTGDFMFENSFIGECQASGSTSAALLSVRRYVH